MRTPPLAIRQTRHARLLPLAAAVGLALSQAAYAAESFKDSSPAARTMAADSGPFVTSAAAPLPRMSLQRPAVSAKAEAAIRVTGANPPPEAGDAAAVVVADYGGTITPMVVDFGRVTVDETSADRSVIIRSTGSDPYQIYQMYDDNFGFCNGYAQLQPGPAARGLFASIPSICYAGDFTCETTCDTAQTYSTNEFCRITARFTPNFSGFSSKDICVVDNTPDSPRVVTLQGVGVLAPPFIISPGSWNFGSVLVGESSRQRSFTIRNIDSKNHIHLSEVRTVGPFELVSTDCFDQSEGFAQAAPAEPISGDVHTYFGFECTAVVEFNPTREGEVTGRLMVDWYDYNCECNEGGRVDSLLSGTGLVGGELTLPDSVEVGAAAVGLGPITHSVAVLNSGTTPVAISSITVSEPFTLLNNCPAILEAGATCTLDIGFTALAAGSFSGTLTVESDADVGTIEIPVHATGQVLNAPLLRLTPNSIGFGDRVIGSQSGPQQVSITNLGGVVATLSLSAATVDFILAGTTCAATLEPQQTCFAQVAFRPLGFGRRIGGLVVSSNASNSPQSVALVGTGCRPFIASGNRSGSSSNCAP